MFCHSLPNMRSVMTLLSIALCLTAGGCSTTVYKDDVASFDEGVRIETATAFDALNAKALERLEMPNFPPWLRGRRWSQYHPLACQVLLATDSS